LAYASGSDMVARFDYRTLGDLLTDTGVRLSKSEVVASSVLATLLDDAAGEIESALRVGQRYSVADLTGLTGNSLALLKRINCAIAMKLCWERRAYLNSNQETSRDEDSEKARRMLDRLRKGEAIFNLDAVADAGLPSLSVPSVSTIQSVNLTVDAARRGYFPGRRLPKS